MSTCEKVDPIEDLIFILCVFEEVVAFEIVVVISVDGCIFEGERGGCGGVVEEYFVGGFGEEEVEVDVVLAGEVFVDCLC